MLKFSAFGEHVSLVVLKNESLIVINVKHGGDGIYYHESPYIASFTESCPNIRILAHDNSVMHANNVPLFSAMYRSLCINYTY